MGGADTMVHKALLTAQPVEDRYIVTQTSPKLQALSHDWCRNLHAAVPM